MTEISGSRDPSSAPEDFRWQAYFQKSSEALFFLNRQRRLLFANRAWELLTGLSLRDLRGQVCKRRRLSPDAGSTETVQNLLAPPAEVMQGRPARCRRLIPALVAGGSARTAPRWWDIHFFPFAGDNALLGIVGKIVPVPREGLFQNQPLPEKIIAARERLLPWFMPERLVAESPVMKRVAEQVGLAAQVRVPILLQGEPGTGKRFLARMIHQQSPRREGSFAVIDCQRLPQRALAEALFGESGLARRLQVGTLYLREPAHLPRELQDRLCPVLTAWSQQENPGPALIAGFDGDPEQELQAGRLLPDLHWRLSTFVIPVPALRDRAADVPQLIDRLLEPARAAAGTQTLGLTEDAQTTLRNYAWPGNVAELYQVLVAACLRAEGERVEAAELPFHVRSLPVPPSRPLPLDTLLEQVERRLMLLALRQTRNNKTEAAELLSIWRQRLIRRMEALGIEESP